MSSSTKTLTRLWHDWRPKAARWSRHGAGYLRFVTRRFLEDQCLLWAGMLCYATLLALVPLMVVGFGVISAFPVFDQWSASLQDFIFQNFVPATGEVLQSHVDRFVEQATELSAVGVLGLILTAILLMVNMERVMNRIWRAGAPRSPGSRFVVYWSVVTVGPLLLGASVAISSYVASLPFVERATALLGVRGLLLGVAPFVASGLAFTLIFVIVPNVSVRWRHAAAGGLLAAALFEAAKKGFTLYVTRFPTYETLYGAFAAVPMFLIWVYLSWTITLIGASFGAALERYRPGARDSGRPGEFVLLYRLLRHLWRAQKEGKGLTTGELLEREPRAGHDPTVRLLEILDARRIVDVTDDGSWLLARDLDEVRLTDLFSLLSIPLPEIGEEEEADVSDALREALGDLGKAVEDRLGRPLTEFF